MGITFGSRWDRLGAVWALSWDHVGVVCGLSWALMPLSWNPFGMRTYIHSYIDACMQKSLHTYSAHTRRAT